MYTYIYTRLFAPRPSAPCAGALRAPADDVYLCYAIISIIHTLCITIITIIIIIGIIIDPLLIYCVLLVMCYCCYYYY